jgi:hypothetical protein
LARGGLGGSRIVTGPPKTFALSLAQVVGYENYRLEEAEGHEYWGKVAISIFERFAVERSRPATFNVAVVTDKPIKVD